MPQDRACDVAVEWNKTKGVGAERSRGDAAVHGLPGTRLGGWGLATGLGLRKAVREFVHGRGPVGTKRSASAE